MSTPMHACVSMRSPLAGENLTLDRARMMRQKEARPMWRCLFLSFYRFIRFTG